MFDPVEPRRTVPPPLSIPALDPEVEMAALEDEAGEVRPSRTEALQTQIDRGQMVAARELFEVFDHPSSEARFFELLAADRVYAPDADTVRYAVARFGERLRPYLDAWASPGAPALLASWGSRRAANVMVRRFNAEDPTVVQDTNRWAEAHFDVALSAAARVAGTREDTALGPRRWLAEQWTHGPVADVLRSLVREALEAGEPPAAAAFPDGSPAVTLRWAARRVGLAAIEDVITDEDRERLAQLLEPERDAHLETAPFRTASWWPPEVEVQGERLDPDALEALTHGWLPHHPRLTALRARLSPELATATAHAILDAFTADKAKPTHRWAFVAACSLAPDEMVPRLARHAWAWSRAKNRNHRNLVAHVVRLFRDLASSAAIARLVLWAESLARTTHREHAQRALEWLCVERGVSLDRLSEEAVLDLGLEADGTLGLDYGARRFVIRFSSDGKAQVRDEAGAARARLPKPGVRDDAAMAEAARARFAAVRDDLKHLLRVHRRRLERGFCERRRYTEAEVQRLAADPVQRLVVEGLVFAHRGEPFRIASDGSLRDVADEALNVEGLAQLLHPMELGLAARARWGDALAELGLAAPFPQLDRQVYAAEVVEGRVALGAAWVLHPGSLVGLLRRGWTGEWRAGGSLVGLSYPIEGGRVRLQPPPFVAARAGMYSPMPIGPLHIDAAECDPITLSELLRDLAHERVR